MPGPVATIIAALIGSLLGSIGAAYVQYQFRRKDEIRLARERIIERYLLQLQDAAESLWYRLLNIGKQGAISVMASTYYEETTLFAIGRVLAYERIFLWDGVYLHLKELKRFDPTLGDFLRVQLLQMDRSLDKERFQRYHRLALAEMVMEREAGFLRTGTYLEFEAKYDALSKENNPSLKSAKNFVNGLHKADGKFVLSELMTRLQKILERLEKTTGIETTINPELMK